MNKPKRACLPYAKFVNICFYNTSILLLLAGFSFGWLHFWILSTILTMSKVDLYAEMCRQLHTKKNEISDNNFSAYQIKVVGYEVICRKLQIYQYLSWINSQNSSSDPGAIKQELQITTGSFANLTVGIQVVIMKIKNL